MKICGDGWIFVPVLQSSLRDWSVFTIIITDHCGLRFFSFVEYTPCFIITPRLIVVDV